MTVQTAVLETPLSRAPLALPKTMHLNLTNACNLNCRICRPEDFKYTAQYLDRPVIQRVIDEVFDSLTELRLDSSGELLMAKELPYVLAEATRRDIPTKICTNGVLITDEIAEMLCRSSITNVQISLDSPDKETLEWIRTRAKFEKVLGGARTLVKWRSKLGNTRMRINFHGAVLRQNLPQLPDLVRLAKDVGVDDVSFAYGFIHGYMDPEWAVFWDQESYRETMKEVRWLCDDLGIGFNAPPDFGQPILASRRCDYLFEKTYVNPDGQVAPCCIGPDGYTGDLKKSSFADIWHGDTYRAFRDTYDTPAPAFDKCAACYIMQGWDPGDYKPHFDPRHWPYVTARLAGTFAPKAVDGAPVTMFVRDGDVARRAEQRRQTAMPRLAERRILLFGAGAGAQEAYTVLESHGVADRIVAVCDNDVAKHGTMFRHLPVQALDAVPRDSYDYVIIGSIPGKVAITAQLEALGLRMRTEFGTLWFLMDQVLKKDAA